MSLEEVNEKIKSKVQRLFMMQMIDHMSKEDNEVCKNLEKEIEELERN